MTVRQLRANYAGSVLGLWWAVVTPLLLAVSINFIFTVVFKVTMRNYYLFVLAGIIPWTFFINALNEATNSFAVNRSILKQGVFPREIVPVSCVLSYLLNFFIGFVFLLPLFAFANLKAAAFIPALFVLALLEFIFIAGLSMLFASLNVLWPDLRCMLPVLFMVWFWITPVFYSQEMLAFPLRWITIFNPVTHYIVAYQKILFEAKMLSFSNLLGLAFLSFLSIAGGGAFFIANEAQLLKRI